MGFVNIASALTGGENVTCDLGATPKAENLQLSWEAPQERGVWIGQSPFLSCMPVRQDCGAGMRCTLICHRDGYKRCW